MNKTLSGRLREYKNKLSNLTSGPSRLGERSLTRPLSTKFKSQFKRGFKHDGGCNQSWSLTRVVARNPESFSFSQALEISRQYLLLRTVILQNKVAGCPCRSF